MDSKAIIWSERISALQYQTDLPKVVLVEDGYYDDNDDTTLSNGDVLTLHVRKNVRSYNAVSGRGEEISIPTSIEAKVETVPHEKPKIYNIVEDLVKDGVTKVEWIHNTPWLKIDEGDILQIHEVVDKKGTNFVRMSFAYKKESDVFVPLNYRSVFKADTSRTLWLGPGKENQFEYPVTVKLIDETLKVKDENNEDQSTNLSTLADIGEITLREVQETEVFIASVKDEENRIIVMKIPSNLEITVRGGLGIVDDEDDYTYANVCMEYNKRARLEQMDENNFNSIRIGNTKAEVERIYEVVDFPDSESESEHEYIEAAPKIPSRVGREPLHQPSSADDDDDDDDDYEQYDENYNNNNNNQNEENRVIGREPEGLEREAYSVCNVTKEPPSDIQTGCCCFRRMFKKTHTIKHAQYEPATTPARVLTPPRDRYVEDRVLRGETLQEDKHDFQIPSDLRGLSIDEVQECLKLLHLTNHIQTFKQNQIDGGLLVTLDEHMLEELGMINSFEKRKLLTFIQGWRPQLL